MKHLLAPVSPEERARRDLAALWDDAGPWIGRSPAEHAAALADVLKVADAQVAGSPIGPRLRRSTDPRSSEAEALWQDLVRRRRRTRGSTGSPSS